jgi:hypothetical protein
VAAAGVEGVPRLSPPSYIPWLSTGGAGRGSAGECFCHTPVTACEYPALDSPEVPMTVPEPSMIRGPLIAEIASSRSPLRRFRDERFPWGPARSATALPGGSSAHRHSRGWRTAPECPWSSRLMAVGQPGRVGRPGAMEGEGAVAPAGERAGASRQLAPAGGGAAACAAGIVVPAEEVFATTRTAMEPPQWPGLWLASVTTAGAPSVKEG